MLHAGGEYVASHNETAVNITSTLLPTVNVCVEGNRTYTVGEKIVRGCEEKCVCGESGAATDCRPLCSSPYVRANRGIEDPLCQEKIVNEEPCCAILVCAADSGELLPTTDGRASSGFLKSNSAFVVFTRSARTGGDLRVWEQNHNEGSTSGGWLLEGLRLRGWWQLEVPAEMPAERHDFRDESARSLRRAHRSKVTEEPDSSRIRFSRV